MQLDALKRVIDIFEQKAISEKRIAQTERWQNKKADLLKALEDQSRKTQEKNVQ